MLLCCPFADLSGAAPQDGARQVITLTGRAHGLAAWASWGGGVAASGWPPAGLQLHSSLVARLPTRGDTLGQCPSTEVGEGLLTPEVQPCSSPGRTPVTDAHMASGTVPSGPPALRGLGYCLGSRFQDRSRRGNGATALPLPTSQLRGAGGAGRNRGAVRGRSAHCRPAQGSVMSLPVRRGRGPGCFSGELELEWDKARPAGAMELQPRVLLWELVLLQSECRGGGWGVRTPSGSE